MKNLFYISFLMLNSVMLFAQQPATNTPLVSPPPPPINSPILPPNYSGGIMLNYVRTIEPRHPSVSESDLNSARTDFKTVEQTVFSDGFMRPLQVVSKKLTPVPASVHGKDLVYHYNYDEATGLIKRNLLPYAKQDASSQSTSKFNKTVQTDLIATYAQLGYTNEEFLYQETAYEASLRALPLSQSAQGKSWVGMNAAVATNTRTLEINDDLKHFSISAASASVPFINQTAYATNEVIVTSTIDEDGNVDKTFTTVLGDKVAHEKNGTRTYYVYDIYHRLRYVITPKALEEFAAASWAIDVQVLNNLCFNYEYNILGNMTELKKPGIATTKFSYDDAGRVVFSQDGVQRNKGQWIFHKYDVRGRLIQQGIFTGGDVGVPILDLNDGPDGTPPTPSAATGGPSLSLLDYIYNKKIYSTADYEYAFPHTAFIIHYYFDDYSFKNRLVNTLNTYTMGQLGYVAAVGAATEGYVKDVTENTQGLLTGIHTAVSDNSRWLVKVNYYNKRGELIQTIADDLHPRFNITGMGYDYNGNMVKSIFQNNDITIQKKYTYDIAGRLTFVKHKIGNTGDYRQIAQYTYDVLGRLKSKILGSINYPVNYEYNIRNWVVGINKHYVTQPDNKTYFGIALFYENGYEKNNLNGRLAGIRWRSTGTANDQRSYGYLYDGHQMLQKADYYESSQPANVDPIWGKPKDFTTDDLTYDANGNILSMTHMGLDANHNPIVLDKLNYTYEPATNKLMAVDEDAGLSQSFDPTHIDGLGDFRDVTSPADYLYDANGNITADLNRGVGDMVSSWFTLNKPLHIELTNEPDKSIDYVYDALGNVLTKTIHFNDPQTNTPTHKLIEYVGDAVYEQGNPTMIMHDEGRVRIEQTSPTVIINHYDYFLKDHLENIRCIITEAAQEGGGLGDPEGDPGGSDPGPGASLPNNPIGYIATSEINNQPWETQLFERVDETRSPRPGMPENGNQFSADLSTASTATLGPGKLIKVMAGDRIQLGAEAFYQSGTNPEVTLPLQTIIGQLITAIAGAQTTGGETVGLITQAHVNTAQLVTTIGDLQDEALTDTTQPAAYLNYLVFDDAFNINYEASGAIQVQQADAWQNMDVPQFEITQSGYIYAFTSNQSQMSVQTDNLYMYHWQGRVLEEFHYYPYGLTFEVTKAENVNGLNGSNNRYNSQSIERNEFTDPGSQQSYGLNWYDFMARSYDMQIGRWMQPDPLMQHASPYLAMSNNPSIFTDPMGLSDGNDISAYMGLDWKTGDEIRRAMGAGRGEYYWTSATDYESWGRFGESVMTNTGLIKSERLPFDQTLEQEYNSQSFSVLSKQAIDYGKADAARAAQQKLRTAQKNMVNNEAGKGAQRGVVKNSDAYFTQLQYQATTEALVLLGFDRASVMRDVVPNNRYGAILKNPNPYLKAFNSGIFDSKNGFTAYQSNQLGKSLYALKFYPDRGNTLGIIYSNPTDHFFETMAEVLELIYGKTGANHYMHEWNATGFLKYKGK